MRDPLVYELNTRCWLRDLSAPQRTAVTLDAVPDREFERWRQCGFTHLWLMGVWTTGPQSRAATLASDELRRILDEVLPDWNEADVAGSPFAVGDYQVPRALGGESGLKRFREKLHRHGLKLLLDFVPNHLGLDHPWVSQKPELFVQSEDDAPETIRVETNAGAGWLAHGKDPNFPAWNDTIQLDYRRADTRSAMLELLQSIAGRCDGVRCDMAMLLLNDVFARTWDRFPCSVATIDREFWADAIQVVKQSHPQFLFLGEVYWDLEARLQSLGFDYTYDKRLYDYLVRSNFPEVQRHLLSVTPDSVKASAHFLENHDEPRITSILSPPEHRAAALLALGLPGMRLLHEGQLTGARIKTPVQLARRPVEPVDPEMQAAYDQLLTTLKFSAVGRGDSQLLQPRPAWADNPTAQNFVVVQWQSTPESFEVVVVNLARHRSQCFAPLTVPDLARRNWRMKDLLSDEEYQRFGDDLQRQGLYLDLPGHGAQVFHFEPVG